MTSPPTIRPATPLTALAGVGPRTGEQLAAIGLSTVGDLLAHLPMRYEQVRSGRTILDTETLVAADGRARVTLDGVIERVRRVPGRRPRVEALLSDDTATATLTWFNAPWMTSKLVPGVTGRAIGEASLRKGRLALVNPRWTNAHEQMAIDDAPANETPSPADDASRASAASEPAAEGADDRIRPVYRASETFGSQRIEALVDQVLEAALDAVDDPLPEAYRRTRALPALSDAWRDAHRPESLDAARAARRRLAFDELLVMQLAVMMRRRQLREGSQAPALPGGAAVDARIRARLPFTLTPAQERVIGEIGADLAQPIPMNRLLQGDVGAGKTAVAVAGMLLAVAHGHQAALMAPTEILAEQHLASIERMLEGSDVRVTILTGTLPARLRREREERIAAGEIDLVVGTHALLTDAVRFRSLALAVIDEQHRFGVTQRAILRGKSRNPGSVPHVLVMTATPIPRTLSLTVFGDLDVSVIGGRPPGREPAITRVLTASRSAEAYRFVAERLRAGEQAYVVVPVVDESSLGLKDVASHLDSLARGPFAGLRLEAMHGRLDAPTREAIMERFRAGEIDCLVATTVIEVGVDVANATMIVIEHAERFGLAQLHQLRGRVGRGGRRGLCVLVADPTTPDGEQRIEAIAKSDDGFEIAELDLAIRGPGELFGSRQSGLPPLRVADLENDADLLRQARTDARAWIDRSPRLDAPNEIALRRLVLSRYGRALGLGDVG